MKREFGQIQKQLSQLNTWIFQNTKISAKRADSLIGKLDRIRNRLKHLQKEFSRYA